MLGLPLKYSLKFGLKKFKGNILPVVISILLCSVCAVLLAYAEAFMQYNRFTTAARTVKTLNEEDYKYGRFYHNDGTSSFATANYLCENYSALKYVNIGLSDNTTRAVSQYFELGKVDFFVINTADDILSFGYTFYGNYDKTISDNSAYISDTYLKDGKFYLYENGKWELQNYRGNADTSSEWFSSFVGKSIYLEGYDGARVEIAGVVNTGAYELSFRDLGLVGEDEYENNINQRRNNDLYSSQQSAIGGGVFCNEAFIRSFAVKIGSMLIGAQIYSDADYYDDGHEVSYSLTADGESASFIGKENITVSNTARAMDKDNRLSSVDYADDKDYHGYYLRETTENDEFIDPEKEVVCDLDICGENEIMITKELYKQLFDGKYDYSNNLPSHIGEKITVNITIDGKTYEIKDKTLVGVYESPFYYYTGDWDQVLGIICPCDEVDELIADYSLANYGAVVNIGDLNESDLAELLRALDEDYNCPIYTFATNAANFEAESAGNVKNVYIIISVALLILSLLFGVWNVLHTVKRDYREIGILKANGVTTNDISIIYAVQFILSGTLAFMLSLTGLNILIANYRPSNHQIINYMQYFPELKLYWVGWGQIFSLLAICLIVPPIVSIFAFVRIRKISPVEAINEAKRNE